jgi:hypothetical protein
MPQEAMQPEACFTNLITKPENHILRFHALFLAPFAPFRGQQNNLSAGGIIHPVFPIKPFGGGRHRIGEPIFTMNTPSLFRRVLAALLFALVPLAVHAGAPLICHPYDISGSGWKSLPSSGKDHFGLSASYDRTNVVNDTLALLTPDTPIIVRMETLRRAALYATNEMSSWRTNKAYGEEDRSLALGLLAKLRERTQDAAMPRDLALFDLGFYAETLRHTRLDPALDGYQLLLKAAESRPHDADIQFALALATAHPKRKEHSAHLASASAGAKPGTLLAANLRTHFAH